MIFSLPGDSIPVDQGDIIDDCPLSIIQSFDANANDRPKHLTEYARVYVLTQTCDLAHIQGLALSLPCWMPQH